MRIILVADDEPAIRRISRRQLEIAGYTEGNGFGYVETDKGEDSWRIYLEQKPSLLILDDRMDDFLSGSSVARRIREGYEGSKPDLITPIISASATVEIEDLPRNVDVLRKPYSPLDLATLARKKLGDPTGAQ